MTNIELIHNLGKLCDELEQQHRSVSAMPTARLREIHKALEKLWTEATAAGYAISALRVEMGLSTGECVSDCAVLWNATKSRADHMNTIIDAQKRQIEELRAARDLYRKTNTDLAFCLEGLDRIAKLGNEPCYGNSDGNRIAIEMLKNMGAYCP